MLKISKEDLVPVINISLFDDLGNDYWEIFSIPQNDLTLIIYFSQSVRGWESEEWYSFDLTEKNILLFKQIQKLNNPVEQIKLLRLIEKERFYF